MAKKISHKQKRLLFVAIVFIASISSLWFVIDNFRQNLLFFYAPTEFWQTFKQRQSHTIRVGGLVKFGSINKTDSLITKFIITDQKQEMFVIYQGLLPDLFRENQGVIAKGNFDWQNKVFIASQLLVKHDEKYMPPEVAKTLKSK
jgi:cytochrome c-type biogenesis protein CcmE